MRKMRKKMIKWFKNLFTSKPVSNSGHRSHHIPSCIHHHPTNSPPENNNSHIRAIAVAAATADAAVAAAQAAVAYVRITNRSRLTGAGGDRENKAAIKIQSLFRGYLSRKALRALKSLVKIQALVRGYLVRKEVVATLHGMEALFRARSSVCEYKFRLQDDQIQHTRSIREASEGRRKGSSSFQIHNNDGRLNTIDPDHEESKSRLTRINTRTWSIDQTPSPLYTNPCHLSILVSSNLHEFNPRFSTNHNTPRFAYSCGPESYGSIYDGLSKDDSFASHPGYMANTKSFRAKVRSRSVPKQRPEFGFGLKKGDGFAEVEYGLKMEKSKFKSPGLKNSFKNYVMDWKVNKKST